MKDEIERDEAINNEKMIAAEYDLTVDLKNGKVFLASNLDGSQVIIQGIMPAYRKDNPEKGGETISFDRDNLQEGCNAYFTGNVYFEHIPCNTVVNGTREDIANAQAQAKPVIEEAVIVKEEKVVVEETKAEGPGFPDLTKKPKTVVAPSGLSRTERKEWWKTLRKMYPESFDANGNYIMFEQVAQKEETKEQKEITKALTEIKAETKVKTETVPILTNVKDIGVGAGNSFTTMADHKVRSSFFMGQYFAAKDSYSVLSTPAKIFDDAKFIFVNKERTADMFLAALRKSPSFTKLLNGHESVVPATVLKNTIFIDKYPVYYVTNVVTAMQALGLQAIAQEDIK